MKDKKDFKKILQSAKLKSTSPRLVILKALSEIKSPETAQEIHKRLKKIDLVTLYRTLASFEKTQLVRRVDMHQDAVYYELNTAIHHHHIICTRCGVVEDFEVCDMHRLAKKIIAKSLNFKTITEHNFELFGVCNACVKNQS